MAGQLWSIPTEGGYMYSDELSDVLRQQVQPLTKMRQLCDAEDGTKKGLNRGDKYNWDVYSNVGTQGRRLDEGAPVPETNFTIIQHQLTVFEAGNSVHQGAEVKSRETEKPSSEAIPQEAAQGNWLRGTSRDQAVSPNNNQPTSARRRKANKQSHLTGDREEAPDKEPAQRRESPYTGKLVALAKHQVAAIIDKTLKDDARFGRLAA